VKKLTGILVLLVLILVIAPVLITQATKPERRHFRSVALEDTQYTEISFRNTAQNIELGGMLFVPPGKGPFPAVVVIQGSGTSVRNNGWYLTLTQYLQKNDVIVLLPDKRGSEKSGGDWRSASFEDLATDTLAAIQYLRNQGLAAISKIGVVGMSQGGWIAPIVASESSDVEFLVNVVGTSLTTQEQLLYEENYNLRQMGFLPGISNIVALLSTSYIKHIGQKKFWDAIGGFDPLPYWKRLTIDTLTLYGREDTNVPSVKSAERLRALNNPRNRVRVYDGSGHALQDPVGQGDNIIREQALEDIRDFIRSESDLPLQGSSSHAEIDPVERSSPT
jgi:dienelactone hydrolase